MKALVGTFNQEKALVGAFSVIVQPVVEPMDRFAALIPTIMMVTLRNCPPVILPEMLLLWSMPPLTQALQEHNTLVLIVQFVLSYFSKIPPFVFFKCS